MFWNSNMEYCSILSIFTRSTWNHSSRYNLWREPKTLDWRNWFFGGVRTTVNVFMVKMCDFRVTANIREKSECTGQKDGIIHHVLMNISRVISIFWRLWLNRILPETNMFGSFWKCRLLFENDKEKQWNISKQIAQIWPANMHAQTSKIPDRYLEVFTTWDYESKSFVLKGVPCYVSCKIYVQRVFDHE